MEVKKLIGNRIKSLRKRKGYSQEKLAEIAGINPKYLSSIERGEENPTLDLFTRLSQGLRVSVYEMFQIEHEGEQSNLLRKRLKALLAEVKEEDLGRIIRILEAIIH